MNRNTSIHEQNYGQDEFLDALNIRSDDRIEEDVCNILLKDKDVDASKIEVSVKDGVVTLAGTVDSRETRFAAERAVVGVMGLKDIQNKLKTKKIPKTFSKRLEVNFSGSEHPDQE
ncbi:MAG: BON domain-containing protein [Bacteriovorax sp.]|jgi:osmotically-inducible protein OsmY